MKSRPSIAATGRIPGPASARPERTARPTSMWLGISATKQPVPYFQTLLNIERDALRAGRRHTFLLLQDDTKGWWVLEQEGLFVLAQAGDQPLPPAKVQTVGKITCCATKNEAKSQVTQSGIQKREPIIKKQANEHEA